MEGFMRIQTVMQTSSMNLLRSLPHNMLGALTSHNIETTECL